MYCTFHILATVPVSVAPRAEPEDLSVGDDDDVTVPSSDSSSDCVLETALEFRLNELDLQTSEASGCGDSRLYSTSTQNVTALEFGLNELDLQTSEASGCGDSRLYSTSTQNVTSGAGNAPTGDHDDVEFIAVCNGPESDEASGKLSAGDKFQNVFCCEVPSSVVDRGRNEESVRENSTCVALDEVVEFAGSFENAARSGIHPSVNVKPAYSRDCHEHVVSEGDSVSSHHVTDENNIRESFTRKTPKALIRETAPAVDYEDEKTGYGCDETEDDYCSSVDLFPAAQASPGLRFISSLYIKLAASAVCRHSSSVSVNDRLSEVEAVSIP